MRSSAIDELAEQLHYQLVLGQGRRVALANLDRLVDHIDTWRCGLRGPERVARPKLVAVR